jgi:hypothetical protein
MPKQYIEKYQKIVTKFIWNNKPPKVKYKTMINSIENGGLKLQDISCKKNALTLNWLKRIHDEEYASPWKTYLSTHFKVSLKEVMQYNYTSNMYPHIKDEFYNEMLSQWAEIHYFNPIDNEQICRQMLWNNANLKSDGKCFNYNIYIYMEKHTHKFHTRYS